MMKEMITAILVDDETSARDNLRFLLNSYCNTVEIIGEASNVDDAIIEIHNKKPQLVFLDIEMPEKNGFQLLHAFPDPLFQVIFVTAYSQYAIKAFKIAAIDYLLKPVEIDILVKSVEKAVMQINKTIAQQELEVLRANKTEVTKIGVPYQQGYVIIDISDIESIQADRMYSRINTKNQKTYVSAKKLQYYEELLSENGIIRVHRSWLINFSAITLYSKKDRVIELNHNNRVPLSKGFKSTFEMNFKM
ncbi:LytR/AlgR family response regulator transcription factor [Tenacibaculum sp. 190524A05c]|uniref:LytR/AlgR family response regulator transcription factor n=1 Tax=Tenacibaculum platacis TaxID=3137852 RepID=UPI0032B216D3